MKSVRKPKKTSTKRRRKPAVKSVTPVAVRLNNNSSQAAIPVAIKRDGEGAQAEALVPVEVKTAGRKVIKRAALMPVTVRAQSATAKAMRRQISNAVRPVPVRQEPRRSEANEPQDILTRAVVAVTSAEESAVNMAGQFGISMLTVLPKVVRTALEVPFRLAARAGDRAADLYYDAAETMQRIAA